MYSILMSSALLLFQVFFRPGVLSQLEAGRDEKLTGIVTQFQALCRGYLGRKKTERLRVWVTTYFVFIFHTRLPSPQCKFWILH